MAALFAAAGCQGPDELFRGPDAEGLGPSLGGGPGGGNGLAGASGGPTGAAGSMITGLGGATSGAGGAPSGAGGSPAGTGGRAGSAGTTGGSAGRGGSSGTSGAAGTVGAAGRGGSSGGAGAGGRGGSSGGSGAGGRGGSSGGAGAGGRGGSSGGAGAAGTTGVAGRGGSGGGAPPTVVFSDDFEADTLAATAATNWTRSGGSSGDWAIASDTTQVFRQAGSLSSTPRSQYASGASGAPWSGATSVAARVKLTAIGSSNQAAMVCLRYTNSSNYYCAAIVPTGVQIQTIVGGTSGSGAILPATIATGTWYDLKIGVDASGVLSVTFGGAVLGTYTPAALASGYAALTTASMQAEFDNVVVTQP